MNKASLPFIRMNARPSGLTFKTPASALARWDRTIQAAKSTDQAVCNIDIMGEIGDSGWGAECTTASMIRAQLAAAGKAPVFMTINSPGGDAFEGIAIYNLLREHPAKVTTNVIGIAASAASVIAMAGDEIRIAEAAFLMIHSAWGVVMGNRNDMRDFADVLDQLDTAVAELYARRAGMPVAKVMTMMEKETWMTGADAVENGFADIAVADKKKAKSAATQIFAQAPAALLGASADRQRHVVRLSAATSPGASGLQRTPTIPRKTQMNIREQIAALEAKRAASAARREEIQMKAVDAGRSKDDAEKEEFATLSADITTIDAELVDLRLMESQLIERATPITPAAAVTPQAAADLRGGGAPGARGTGVVSINAKVEPGIAYARYVQAMMRAKGDPARAEQIAMSNASWGRTTPQVAEALHLATVTGADTVTAGWASELVYNQNLASEFIEYLRPMTIIGRIPNLTRVPFNVRIAGESGTPTAYWVGQGAPIPVSKSTTMSITMGIAKAAGMCVLTKELIMSSTPSAELMIRNSLAKTIIQFLDQQFIAPDYAAVANVNPASITNGVVPIASTGTTSATLRTDFQTLFASWIANNVDPTGAVLVMTATQALALSLMVTSLGAPVFPDITMAGGKIFGLPVIVSQSAMQVGSPVTGEGNLIVLINAPDILLADEGEVVIDASGEASVQMLDNPTTNAQAGTATTMVSMWQTDSVAVRAIRHINWAKKRSTAVAYIKDAAYVS